MNNEKIADELLTETRTPQDAYEYAFRREKGTEHSRTMKSNAFRPKSSSTIKQELRGYFQPRGRGRQSENSYKNQKIFTPIKKILYR